MNILKLVCKFAVQSSNQPEHDLVLTAADMNTKRRLEVEAKRTITEWRPGHAAFEVEVTDYAPCQSWSPVA